MDVGFETIGNATLVCHDRKPLLVTDPWISGSPYFGSWTQSHEIPTEQMEAIASARYAWVSHGHPDHLSLRGLRSLKARTLLLPDHVGGRIAGFLRSQGYDVVTLRDRVWYRLSDRIRVLCISDYNQDGILLVDINGRLVVDLNDASDSVWAGRYTTGLRDYEVGFESPSSTLLPAFVRVGCAGGDVETIEPPERPRTIREPEEFGDDWAEELGADDAAKVDSYFRSVEHLGRHFDFINVRVGGRDNMVSLSKRGFHRGFTFEVPRTSLIVAIENEIFDDLLIGNFMKTTLHGGAELYPDFTPFVAKYADNGGAKSRRELRRYRGEYMRRAPFDYLRDRFERRSRDVVRSLLPEGSGLYRITRGAYKRIRGW